MQEELCCPICLEEYDNESAFALPCGHMYHADCIERWLENKDECPVCRTPARENADDVVTRPLENQAVRRRTRLETGKQIIRGVSNMLSLLSPTVREWQSSQLEPMLATRQVENLLQQVIDKYF